MKKANSYKRVKRRRGETSGGGGFGGCDTPPQSPIDRARTIPAWQKAPKLVKM